MAHTPAPWKANWNKHYFQIDSKKDGQIGDACASQFIIGNTDKGKANALLMAAAPELLEALEFIVEQITNEENKLYTLEAYVFGIGINKAKKAIAKAKGES